MYTLKCPQTKSQSIHFMHHPPPSPRLTKVLKKNLLGLPETLVSDNGSDTSFDETE